MKLKKEILDMIKNPMSCNRIGCDLQVAGSSVSVQVRANKVNGRLTKMDALNAISRETGVPVDQLCEGNTELVSQN